MDNGTHEFVTEGVGGSLLGEDAEEARAHSWESSSPEIVQRLQKIRKLQRQAMYPLDTVGGTWALSQLAQVEVPWLTACLEEAMIRMMEPKIRR